MRALQYRNYRIFFCGQSISSIGTWMQLIALSWLVYRMTHSAFLLGLVAFTGQISAFLFAPFSGVLIDRWSRRHRILLITQPLAMIQALTLAVLALTGRIALWHIIALSIFLGLINGLDIPTRHSFIVDIIDKKEDLANAIVLNSLIFNGARLLGPAIAGVVIVWAGEAMCFFLNGASYLAIIIALLIMRIGPRKIKEEKNHILQELKEGFRYTFGFAPIRKILLLFALINLVGASCTVLMPVFAKEILGGGSHTLGFLVAATGLGALVGGFYIASKKEINNFTKIIPLAAGIFGIGLISFSFSRTFWLSLLLMALIGFGMMLQIASTNTVLQTITDDAKRGRVMSFYTMSFMGMVPLGSLLIGGLASKIGAPNTLLISGLSCILGGLFFAHKVSFENNFSYLIAEEG